MSDRLVLFVANQPSWPRELSEPSPSIEVMSRMAQGHRQRRRQSLDEDVLHLTCDHRRRTAASAAYASED